MRERLKEWVRARYDGRLLPWPLRWARKPERPLLLIVGRRGAGKTLLATKIALGRMRQGQRVYANYHIHDPLTGRRAGFIHSLYDLIDLRDCTVVIDEANIWCNAREWAAIPSDVIGRWQMSRKEGLDLIFTSQHESRVDVVIRQLADWILVCERAPIIPKWVPLFRYHMTYLEDVNEVRRGEVFKPHYWWCSDKTMAAFDTTQIVDPEMMENLRKYQKAIKAGTNPADIGLQLPERIEPDRVLATGEVVEYESAGE